MVKGVVNNLVLIQQVSGEGLVGFIYLSPLVLLA